MIPLRRPVSLRTIWARRSRASSAAPAAMTSTAPDSAASGLRISWAMLAAIRPSVASRSAARMRASIARIADRSSQAAMRPIPRPSPARSAEKVMRTGVSSPSGRRSVTSRQAEPRADVSDLGFDDGQRDPAPEDAPRLTHGGVGGEAGDLLGGPVHGRHPVPAVQRDQTGADRFEDEVGECLEVAQIGLLGLQLFLRRAEALGQPAGHDRHHQERAGVHEDRDDLQRGALRGRLEEGRHRKDGAPEHQPRVERAAGGGDGEAADP